MFTRLAALGHGWMTRREFHDLHGNKCTLKEFRVGQHHAWLIAWSVGGVTKRGGTIEDVLHSASWLPFRQLAKTRWRGLQDRQLDQGAVKGRNAHSASWRPLANRQLYWAMVPRPPKVPVVPQRKQRTTLLAVYIGCIAEPIDESDLALPLSISSHFCAILCNKYEHYKYVS